MFCLIACSRIDEILKYIVVGKVFEFASKPEIHLRTFYWFFFFLVTWRQKRYTITKWKSTGQDVTHASPNSHQAFFFYIKKLYQKHLKTWWASYGLTLQGLPNLLFELEAMWNVSLKLHSQNTLWGHYGPRAFFENPIINLDDRSTERSSAQTIFGQSFEFPSTTFTSRTPVISVYAK